jgi:HAD superfamily hydrolase (TIGR01509 family)
LTPSSPAPAASIQLPGRFRAAIFDMDGLLLDTEPLWAEAERELLERHGDVFTDADREASHGRAASQTARAYALRLGLPEEDIEREILDIMLAHYASGPPLRPGARALIGALDGRMALAVASNTTAPLVERALQAAGLHVLVIVASGADMGRPKPLPDVYLEACRLLDVEPGDAVAFEDSPAGIRAAVAAGLTAVGVPDRGHVNLSAAGAHVVVPSLAHVVVEPA